VIHLMCVGRGAPHGSPQFIKGERSNLVVFSLCHALEQTVQIDSVIIFAPYKLDKGEGVPPANHQELEGLVLQKGDRFRSYIGLP